MQPHYKDLIRPFVLITSEPTAIPSEQMFYLWAFQQETMQSYTIYYESSPIENILATLPKAIAAITTKENTTTAKLRSVLVNKSTFIAKQRLLIESQKKHSLFSIIATIESYLLDTNHHQGLN